MVDVVVMPVDVITIRLVVSAVVVVPVAEVMVAVHVVVVPVAEVVETLEVAVVPVSVVVLDGVVLVAVGVVVVGDCRCGSVCSCTRDCSIAHVRSTIAHQN